MTTKKLKYLIALLACAMLVAFGLLAFMATADDGGEYSFDQMALKEVYSVGETVSFADVKMHKGDKVFDTTFLLTAPDGTGFAGKQITLVQSGKYTATYTGADNGVVKSTYKEFFVAEELYRIGGEGGSNTPAYAQTVGGEGVSANIKYGDTLYFTKSINIADFDESDEIIKFFNIPTSIESHDGNITVRLTDAYNSANYVEVNFKKYSENSTPANTHAYITASFNGGEGKGLRFHNGEYNDASSIEYEGIWYQLDSDGAGDATGATVLYSFIGTPAKGEFGSEALSLSYNYAKKQVFVNGTLIVDLDHPDLFLNGFKGFSTGEVFVSVYGKSYAMDTVNPVILSLTQCDLTKNSLVDREAPVVSVDLCGFTQDAVTGIVGKPFKLFPATAIDALAGEIEVTARVYRNYYSTGRVFVPVTDGAFTPADKDNYFIEYSAVDACGNLGKKVIVVAVGERDNPFKFEINKPATVATAGQTTEAFSYLDIFGGYGDISVEIVALAPNGSQYLIEGNGFMPMSSGEYKVTVTVSDYIESIQKDFTIAVNANQAFLGSPVIEKYFIKGAKYSIAQFNAINFTEQAPADIQTDIFVSEDGGEFAKVNGLYTVNASQTVRIKYVPKTGTAQPYVCPVIPVVDVNYGGAWALDKYFQGEGFTSAISKNDIKYTVIGDGSASADLDFINKVQVERLSFIFGLTKDQSSFERVNVYITDAFDSQNQIKVTYFAQDGKAFYTINDGEERFALNMNFVENDSQYSLSYDNATKTLNAESGNGMVISKALNGEEFNGFASSQAFISVEVEGVESGKPATVVIYSVNVQAFSSNAQILPPQIVHDTGSGDVALGSTFTVNKTIVKDVLDPYVEILYFYVKSPDGNIVTSEEGVLLDGTADYTQSYTVKTTQYGVYEICLSAKNGNGKIVYIPVYDEMNVIDVTAPTVTLGSANTTASVGETVTLATATVSDDKSKAEACKVFIIVENPNGVTTVSQDGRVTVQMRGVYKIRYMIYDENGNIAHAGYTLTVN